MAIIESWDEAAMVQLCRSIREAAPEVNDPSAWPAEPLSICGDAGVYRWFIDNEAGREEAGNGLGWSPEDQTRAYLMLAEADLTTTFVITQLVAAIKRIVGSKNSSVKERWTAPLLGGHKFGTVGISHLTTSRRHLRKPILAAEKSDGGYRLSGKAPWATGAIHADVLVVGATLDDGRQILAAVPKTLDGVHPGVGTRLMALSASATDEIEFRDVLIEESMLIAGPIDDVLKSGAGGGAGGVQTSTLAVGLAKSVQGYLEDQAKRRSELSPSVEQFADEIKRIESLLIVCAGGDQVCSTADLRHRANDLVLRISSAAMSVAKGAGFVDGHPVGRWCQEAMFFLVWSCPQPVAEAHLCDLATSSFQ